MVHEASDLKFDKSKPEPYRILLGYILQEGIVKMERD
jgi:hypothetical protein